ncbi:hypothetical protein ABZZ17_28315 [Streptomyces sp. NPDC006512]|uniref:hypothetical protein n=1 Tax=Streptomyces sp. NPDC006512 TaxID=3154307 RepID=UPI0033AAACFF
MTVQEPAPRSARGDATAYELRMALHALARAVDDPETADPARTEKLLRRVLDSGLRSVRRGPLPMRPFAYQEADRPIGPGALLAEYLDPGTTPLAPLVKLLDPVLLDELAELCTAAEEHAADAGAATYPGPPGPDAVPLPLEPVADWSAIAWAGAVFGAERAEHTEPGRNTVRPAWSALTPSATAETRRALDLARKLVSDMGREQPPRITVDLDLDGVHGPSAVAARGCAASLALAYLAGEAGLPGPAELGVLPLAGCAEDGTWTPYAPLGQVLEAAAREGLRCLWRDETGWRLQDDGEHRAHADPSLAGAARLLWGPSWEEVRGHWARETLDTHDWRVLHPDPGPVPEGGDWLHGDGAPLVALDLVDELTERFGEWPHSRVIQSGFRNSGKTVCARQVVSRLEAKGWRTVVLAPRSRQLPPADALPALVKAALWATGSEDAARTLVVLEDLHALEDGDIGQALASLGDLKIAVLALTRYVDGAATDWDSHGITTHLTQVTPEELRALAQRLVGEHPDAYTAEDDRHLERAVDACHSDLRVLTDLLLRDGHGPDEQGGPEGRLRRQAARVRTTLDAEGVAAVCRIAAVSVLDEGVPESHVDGLPVPARQALGIAVRDGVATIASEVRAQAILAEFSPDGASGLLVHTEEYLLRLLAEDGHERVRALLAHCAAYDSGRLEDLLERPALRSAIVAWAARAHPPTALRLLRLCGEHSEAGWITATLPTVVSRVRDTPALSVGDLTTALLLLWDHQYALDGHPVTRELLEWIGGAPEGGMDAVLARPSTLSQRFGFVRALLRLSGNDTVATDTVCGWAETRAEELVRGASVGSHHDLVHVRRMDDLLYWWSREARGATEAPRDGRKTLRPLEKPAQRLLEEHPTSQTPLAAVLSWMSLRLYYDGDADWDKLIRSHERQIRAGIARADAIQISSALADLAKTNRGLCTRLLNTLELARPLVSILKKASPAEASILIATVRNIHGATVKSLLYSNPRGAHESPKADVALARELVRGIRRHRDARGAGMLLTSVSLADDLYCDTREGFGYRLACEIGPELARDLLESERRRPAIVYHFLRGLWEAGADYREDLEEQALQLVVSSIRAQRGAARPWGPRLAMLLIEDDYFGQEFLRRLAERIDPQMLCDRMLNPRLDPQSMVYTHRLGLAIDPDIGKEYARRVKLDLNIRGQLATSPSHLAQKLQVTANTLRAGGRPDATLLVLKQFRQEAPEWDWTQKIRKIGRSGAFTDAVNTLRGLDPGAASGTVAKLTAGEDPRLSPVQDLLARSVVNPALTADLLVAVERCVPGGGKKALEHLRDRPNRWRIFTEGLTYEQDPIQQGNIGRMLAPLGVMPRQETTGWMRTLVFNRWASTLPSMAGPMAISAMLRLSHIWQPQWGEQLAACVDERKLLRRLDLGMRPDLRNLPGLINVLRLTGRDDVVESVVHRLASFEPRLFAEALGLKQGAELLRALRQADADPGFFAPAFGQLLTKVVGRPLVTDAEKHWISIGWAAQMLRDVGFEGHVTTARPVLEPQYVPFGAYVAWAATWLPASDWSTAALPEALDAFERGGDSAWHPRATAMALVAAARAGRLAGTEALDSHWWAATEAGPSLLTLLCREAEGTPAIAAYLRTPRVAAALRAKVAQAGATTWFCHRELSALVGRLCPPAPPRPARPVGTLDV